LADSPHLRETPPGAAHVGREILAIDAASGVVRLGFTARPEFANRHGNVAGGYIAAMLDSSAAAPILAFLPANSTLMTTELQVYYLKPAPLGRLFGLGRVTQAAGRVVSCEAELSDPAGTVVARATASFRLMRRRDPAS